MLPMPNEAGDDEEGLTQRRLSGGRLVSMHSINPAAQAAAVEVAAPLDAPTAKTPRVHQEASSIPPPRADAGSGSGSRSGVGAGRDSGKKSANKRKKNKKKSPGGSNGASSKRYRLDDRDGAAAAAAAVDAVAVAKQEQPTRFSVSGVSSRGAPGPASAAARAAFPAVVDSRVTATATTASSATETVPTAAGDATAAPATPKYTRRLPVRGSAERAMPKTRVDDEGARTGGDPSPVVRRFARHGNVGGGNATNPLPASAVHPAGDGGDGEDIVNAEGDETVAPAASSKEVNVGHVNSSWTEGAEAIAATPGAGDDDLDDDDEAKSSAIATATAVGVASAPLDYADPGVQRGGTFAPVAATPTPTGAKKRQSSLLPPSSSSSSACSSSSRERGDESFPVTFTPAAAAATAEAAVATAAAAAAPGRALVRRNSRPMRASAASGRSGGRSKGGKDADSDFDYRYNDDLDVAVAAPGRSGIGGVGVGSARSDASGQGGRRPRPAGIALTGEMFGSPAEVNGGGSGGGGGGRTGGARLAFYFC